MMSGITMVFVPAISTFIISRMLGGGGNLLIGEKVLEQLGAHHEQTAEVEIIAHTAFLIIYDGMRSDHPRSLQLLSHWRSQQ